MKTTAYPDSVMAQRYDIPGIYGDVDFRVVPERLDSEAHVDDERFSDGRAAVRRVFENLAMSGDRFDAVHWLGFSSTARADAAFFIDNLEIKAVAKR